MNNFILQIKKLRKLTFASINDCKKSLTITKGNIDKAINLLKNKYNQQENIKKNIEKTKQRTGKIIIKNTGMKCIKFHVLCKTDFCSRSSNILILSQVIKNFLFTLTYISPGKYYSIQDLNLYSHDEIYLSTIIKEYESFLKEQINIQYIIILCDQFQKKITTYLHHDKLQGALIDYQIICPKFSIDHVVTNFFNNVSMHAMAFNPRFIYNKNIPSLFLRYLQKVAYLKNKKTVFLKNKNISKSIMLNILHKTSREMCLVHQNFLVYDKLNIKKLMNVIEDLLNIQIKIKNICIFKIIY